MYPVSESLRGAGGRFGGGERGDPRLETGCGSPGRSEGDVGSGAPLRGVRMLAARPPSRRGVLGAQIGEGVSPGFAGPREARESNPLGSSLWVGFLLGTGVRPRLRLRSLF